MNSRSAALPWIDSLQARLDRLEVALLQGDAPAVEATSAELQVTLQQAPRTVDLQGHAGALQAAAQRFAQLRAAAVRAAALNERALGSLLPDHLQQPSPRSMGMRSGAQMARAYRGL